jgi:glycosyltransferase involved in cell wall biosynthesis
MRFVLVSTHIDQTTGYSKVSSNLLKQVATLSPKIKTYHFGFQRHPNRSGTRKAPEGVVQYDAAANEDPKEEGFGFNKIHEYLDMVNPDVVMIYNDPLIVYKFIEAMKIEPGKAPFKLWIYVDQVYGGIAQPLIDKINQHADRVYCFTDSWKQVYLKYGGPTPDLRVLGHAVDPSIFTSMNAEGRQSIRANMNIPKDAIVFLNANRNSQRKRLDLCVMGFVRLLSRYPTAPYYMAMATNMNPNSGAYYDLNRIFQLELDAAGLDKLVCANRLMLIDTAPPNVISDETINQLYNATDVGLNTSDGEGYGLCQLEHLYTGAPQIVTDIGAYRSFLTEKETVFVTPGDRVYFAGNMPLGGYVPSFNPNELADAMSSMVATLPQKRAAITDFNFKSWASVCDGWLEDLIAESK